jgi:hypothetical protein
LSFLRVLGNVVKSKARAAFVALVLALGIALFAWVGDRHYPIADWLFWHYAGYWLAVGGLSVGCLGSGALLLDRVFRARLPLLEHVLFAFTLGLFAFEWLMFMLGVFHAYDPATFYLAPLLLLAAGFPALGPLFARIRGVYRRRPARLSPFVALALGFGFVGLLMVYFLVLTPENIQFDSRWKHMALAEDYVVHGGIRRASEGWVFSARPHLTSYLFVWAFLVPSERLFDQMLLCAHLEFFVFVVTTVLGVSALARRLAPGLNPLVAWVARFLFPGVLLYDSSVSGGVDHFGALYAVPIALALFRVLRAFEIKNVLLLVCLVCGAALVKETAALLLVPVPLSIVAARWLLELYRSFRRTGSLSRKRTLLVPLLALGVGLLLTVPFWLKNVVFYGNPVYPSLGAWFPSDPWSEAAGYKFKWSYQEGQMWAPTRDLEGLIETAQALFTFSFIPNDWPRFHRNVPVFGSLFTLLLPALFALRGTRRIWLVVLWIHVGVFAWYSVHHQDRYLQALVPLMAGCVAATLGLIWKHFGPLVRGLVCLLVGLQVVWGGDVYFFQTHAMARSPIKKVVDTLSSGFSQEYEERFSVQSRYRKIGEAVPKGARVMFHEHNMHLGVGRETVLDKHQWQLGIDYAGAGSPEAIRKLLVGLGVTHVYYVPGRSDTIDSLAGDILFHEFVSQHGQAPQRVGGGILVTVPTTPLTKPFRDTVVSLSCGKAPHPGLYRLSALGAPPYGPEKDRYGRAVESGSDLESALEWIPRAEFVVFDTRCDKRPPAAVTSGFEELFSRKGQSIWRRRVARERAPARERQEESPSQVDENQEEAEPPGP